MYVSNQQVADQLEEIATLLHQRGANPFRAAAYRKAARTLRRSKQPLGEILDHDGSRGLRKLPGVGDSLSKKIAEILASGRSKSLERVRRKHTLEDLLTTLPSVGPRLAGRIQGKLGVESLEDLLAAAYDGRLRRVAGLGRKRVEAIRESLAARLHHPDTRQLPIKRGPEPPVSELLEIDRQYRMQAAQRRLLMVRRKEQPVARSLVADSARRAGRRPLYGPLHQHRGQSALRSPLRLGGHFPR